MKNPFEELIREAQPQVEFELASGSFECQEYPCRLVVHEAKYIEDINTLTWICPDGHISKVEDFD